MKFISSRVSFYGWHKLMILKYINKLYLVQAYILLSLLMLCTNSILYGKCILFMLILYLLNTNRYLLEDYKNRQNNMPNFIRVLFFIVIIALLSYIVYPYELNSLDLYLKYLAVPILWFIMPKLNVKILLKFWVLTSICMLGLAIYQYHILQIARPFGISHPIVFGNFAIALALIFYANRNNLKIWFYIGFISCLLTSFYTGSRGGWLALIIIIPNLLSLFKSLTIKRKIYISIFSIIVCVLIINLPMVKQRFIASYYEFYWMLLGNFDTSSGIRFSLWKQSIIYLYNHPFGGGLDSFYTKIFLYSRNLGLLPKEALYLELNHPHNDLLYFATQFGFIGLFWYIILNKSILRYFKNHHELYIKTSGIYFTLGYIIFSLTQAMFAHNRSLLFFCLILIQLSHCYYKENKNV